MKFHEQDEILTNLRSHVTTKPDLSGCGKAVLALLDKALDDIAAPRLSKAVERSKTVIAYATDKFYAYPYKEVPGYWRALYYDASIVLCIALDRLGKYEEMVRVVDMALIMAGEGDQKSIRKVLKWIEATMAPRQLNVPDKFPIESPQLTFTNPIPRVKAPSLEWFQNHMDEAHSPLIITDALHWKALADWCSPGYFLHKTLDGKRIVPIELGESYVSDNWTQKLIPFESFLREHLLRDVTPKGYLAQHNLFSQIPELRVDISIPEYCFSVPPEDPPDQPKVPYMPTETVQENIWMGPKGTRSPLHNDPYENIFAQVVGYKYFRLFAPDQTDKLYPRGVEGGIKMGNTSLVDVERPKLHKFRDFAKAGYVEGVLGAGECLYIPRGWWHFVRSESMSIGVSFWW